MSRLLLTLMAGVLLVGCAQGRYIGLSNCLPDGSIVWYQYQNISGTYDGAKADPKYCK